MASGMSSSIHRLDKWLRTFASLLKAFRAFYSSSSEDVYFRTASVSEVLDQLDPLPIPIHSLMKAIGIDPENLRGRAFGVMWKMEAICAACHRSERCRSELLGGSVGVSYRTLCPNAATLRALKGE
jgi:hypothetical protein